MAPAEIGVSRRASRYVHTSGATVNTIHHVTIRRDQSAGSWLMLVIAMAALFCGTARAAAVVTDHVVSTAGQTQANVPVTFGQIFKKGDVAKGEGLQATLNGHRVALQVDIKATNPDGNLRHAVLTAVVPTLADGASEPLAVSVSGPSTAAVSPVKLAQLLATQYDATVSFDIGGVTYAAHARALLAAAEEGRTCKPWGNDCNVWLAGPLVSEWIVRGSLANEAGVAQPNLKVYFNVRAYADPAGGSISRIRTDIVVENTSAYSAQGQPQYTATLTSGTTSYTSPALTQFAYTRWHKVLWWNDAQPQIYLQQDTQYIQDSMAISRYEKLRLGRASLAKLRPSCSPLDHCDQTKTMGNTGAQPAIGPLPRWTSVYIVDPNVRAYRWMLANTDALGAYSIHYRDGATGWPISIQKRPYVTIANWAGAHRMAQGSSSNNASYRKDLLPNCLPNSKLTKRCGNAWYGTANPNVWDNAHQPAEGYVAYMVTGSFYYMDEVAFGASQNEIWSNEAYRGFSKGLIDRSHSQVRGKAWVLREMANAAYILPDKHPLKSEFNADVNNSLADFNKSYTHNSSEDSLGLLSVGTVYKVHGHDDIGMAPWQHSFLTWSAGHAAELGFAGAAEFRNWLARFEIGLMTDWQTKPTQGYCWLEASAYSIQVKNVDGHWLPSYSAIYAANFPGLVGLACNSSEMVEKLGELSKTRWKVGEMQGYPYSATGFAANLQVGLAAATDSGLPKAAAAWKIFESRSVKPHYDNYPNFAIMPRAVPATATAGK